MVVITAHFAKVHRSVSKSLSISWRIVNICELSLKHWQFDRHLTSWFVAPKGRIRALRATARLPTKCSNGFKVPAGRSHLLHLLGNGLWLSALARSPYLVSEQVLVLRDDAPCSLLDQMTETPHPSSFNFISCSMSAGCLPKVALRAGWHRWHLGCTSADGEAPPTEIGELAVPNFTPFDKSRW